MSKEYDGNPTAKCMKERKGDCFGMNCPCEDYEPAYLMTKEDVETFMPGARERSINPGAIRYKSKHTRIAGEHRYPREDIIVDNYGNKRIGGYDDNIRRIDLSDETAELRNLYQKYPKVRLLCANCESSRLFKIEDICYRTIFVYDCPKCHKRNGLDVSWLKNELRLIDSEEDDYYTFKCARIEVDKSSSFESLANSLQILQSLEKPVDPYRDLYISKNKRREIKNIEKTCIYLVKKCDICIFDGGHRASNCTNKCKNYTEISFVSYKFERQLKYEIWPRYKKTVDFIREYCEKLETQEKKLNKRISDRVSQGLPCDNLDLQKKQLRQEVDAFENYKKRIKLKWNRIVDLNELIKNSIGDYGKNR